MKDFLWSFRATLDHFAVEVSKASQRLKHDLVPETCADHEDLCLLNLSAGVQSFVGEVEKMCGMIHNIAEVSVSKDLTEKCDAH